MQRSDATSSVFETLLTVPVLDAAMAAAAKRTGSTVAVFAAGPAADGASLQVAAEFVVPPVSLGAFAEELDAELSGWAPYRAARAGLLGAVDVKPLPAGTFHQWRHIWGRSGRFLADSRLRADRQLLDGVIRQGEVGWRELNDAI